MIYHMKNNHPWSDKITATKSEVRRLKADGLFPYLIPQSGSYFAIGLASSKSEAKYLEELAEGEKKARDRRASQIVQDAVMNGTAGISWRPTAEEKAAWDASKKPA